MGVAVARIEGGRVTVIRSGVIETKRGDEMNAADDNLRRAREVHERLVRAIEEFKPSIIYGEAMSHPRDSRAAAMLSMSWGIVAAVAARYGIPIEQAGPMPLKASITGKRTASKDEMIAAVRAIYPEVAWERRKDLHEHQADAVAAIHHFTRQGVIA